MTSILVVDDDEDVRELMRVRLSREGYSVLSAKDGNEGLKAFLSSSPDLAILDIRMPNMSGWEVLKRIREVSDTPVIMLTILDHEDQIVQGLDSGADDYLAKPFGSNELMARVRAVLRRVGESDRGHNSYQDSEISVDSRRHKVFVRGQEVKLTPREFRILEFLVFNAGAVLPVERIIDACWGDRPGGPINVRQFIYYLRRKLEVDPANPRLIETVREFGYRYVPPEQARRYGGSNVS